MLHFVRTLCVVWVTLLAQSFAATTVTPTTTLSAETGNNTSAANTFPTSTNGNMGAGNVSKENVHKLLDAGISAKIYAHLMAWWGSASHINIGYESASLTQVHNQISDMMSRGIDGAIIDWYGQGNTRINQSSLYVKQDAESRNGKFEFAIMEDQGAIRACAYTAGCDATQALINDLDYIVNTYAVSPAYMRINGQPVIFTFDVESLPTIDWTRVIANVQGNPKIVLHNDQGFSMWYSSGSYAWLVVNQLNQGDWGQAYLDDFYATSKSYPGMMVYPGTWKGFNDTAASWSQNRVMSQNCGQVWLQTFAELGTHFTGTQAQAVQLITWNDYEEGTEIETGIDNCVSISASATSAGDVVWTIAGQENTIDHYTVFISTDGQNLMKLADVAAGTSAYSLLNFGFAAGNYTVFVEAIGKPSMRNKMSAAVPVTLNVAPTATLSVTPASGTAPVTVNASTSASNDSDGTIVSSTIDFGDGTVATGPNASHTYNNAGTYIVTGTVTDNGGLTARSSTPVMVAPFVVNAMSPVDGSTITGPVHFVATTTSGTLVTAVRVYVDNVSAYTVNASALDTTLTLTPGLHYVVLQAWNQFGQVAKASMYITVMNLPPSAKLVMTPSGGVAPVVVSATASGTDMDGTVTEISIDFGDGTAVSGAAGTHTYNVAGTYTVTARVMDNNGATATAKSTVSVISNAITLSRPSRNSGVPTPAAITPTTDAVNPVVAATPIVTVTQVVAPSPVVAVAGNSVIAANPVGTNPTATASNVVATTSVVASKLAVTGSPVAIVNPIVAANTPVSVKPIVPRRVYVNNRTMRGYEKGEIIFSLNSFSAPVVTPDTTVAASRSLSDERETQRARRARKGRDLATRAAKQRRLTAEMQPVK